MSTRWLIFQTCGQDRAGDRDLDAADDDAGLAYGWTLSAYVWLSAAQAARMEQAIDRATEHAADASLRTDDV